MGAPAKRVGPQIIKLSSKGFPLSAYHYKPASPSSTAPAVLIAPATGVPAYFYNTFGEYLASHGSPVVAFDYRYSGNSFLPGLPSASANANKEDKELLLRAKRQQLKAAAEVRKDREWKWDIEGAIEWMVDTYGSERDLVYVGHSVGGHLLPLTSKTHWKRMKRSLWVGAINPFSLFSTDREEHLGGVQNILDKTREYGYFPGRETKFGSDLPAGIGLQWFGWMKYPEYWAHDHAQTLAEFDGRVLALAFADDTFSQGNCERTDDVIERCPRSPASRLSLNPSELGWKPCGHVNAFSAIHDDSELWNLIKEWLLHGKVSDRFGGRRDFGVGAEGARGDAKL
ncbi:hypothetical protein T439DRAFT_330505 [Meredithblackwellia eburnea MCA 4105]